MTPTPEQLAAVLPRCSAGLDGGDLTDDDERLDWARRVLRYVEEASRQNTEEDIHATIDWLRSLRRDPHDIRHGDTWEVRRGRATIVASNDWPPPAKGTHESDILDDVWGGSCLTHPRVGVQHTCPSGCAEPGNGEHEYEIARDWSRSR